MFSDVEVKMKKKNKILFSRESLCLQELIQLIQKQKHRTIALWALDCAQQTLGKFEEKYPDEKRPRICLELCDAWSRGTIKMPLAKKAILEAHAVAKTINDPEYEALCHAIGHAGATVHVETHAIGLPMYELTSIVISCGLKDYQIMVGKKINYYYDKLLYWQENTDKIKRDWAKFLLDDTRENKEKILKRNSRKD